jgi:hypothetical protein
MAAHGHTAGMVSGDAGIYFLDCLPGIASLYIEQKFVGNLFCFFAQSCCFGAFDGISKEFSTVLKFVFQGIIQLVFGAFIVCFVSAFNCSKKFSFVFREPVRMVSFSSWRSRAAYTMILERTLNDCLSDSDSEMKASMDSVKSTRFFGHARNFQWNHFLCSIFLGLRIVCGSLSTSSTVAWS